MSSTAPQFQPTPDLSGLLAGKVAIITGASRGIGAATARAFAQAGAAVVLAARDERALEALSREIHGSVEKGAIRGKIQGIDIRRRLLEPDFRRLLRARELPAVQLDKLQVLGFGFGI